MMRTRRREGRREGEGGNHLKSFTSSIDSRIVFCVESFKTCVVPLQLPSRPSARFLSLFSIVSLHFYNFHFQPFSSFPPPPFSFFLNDFQRKSALSLKYSSEILNVFPYPKLFVCLFPLFPSLFFFLS